MASIKLFHKIIDDTQIQEQRQSFMYTSYIVLG